MPQLTTDKRSELQMLCLETLIAPDNTVRLIDEYCNSFSAEELGFLVKGKHKEGRPAFKASILVRLYIYGYLNGIRSSRQLAKECVRNLELWWLLNQQKPKYRVIAAFRHDNNAAFYNLFVHFREYCMSIGLYGKRTVAIDGSKFRAQNSKKNNYNLKKIKQHLDYIDDKTKEYLQELDNNDRKRTKKQKVVLTEKIKKLRSNKRKYTKLKKELEQTSETQISITDPDARALPKHMKIVEVSYNVQSAVDDKNNMIVDFHVTNENDAHALVPMVKDVKHAFKMEQDEEITILADKGYHTGQQLEECHEMNVDTLVAPKRKSSKLPPHVQKDKFTYQSSSDTYICPKGQTLLRQGGDYTRKNKNGEVTKFHRYISEHDKCMNCPWYIDCISAGNRKIKRGKTIDRTEYDDAVDRNYVQVRARKEEYRRRQAIVEHPFGHLKRNLGYTYTLLRGLENVDTEFSLIFLTYNFKRFISIIRQTKLNKALKTLFSLIFAMAVSVKHQIMKLKYSLPYNLKAYSERQVMIQLY